MGHEVLSRLQGVGRAIFQLTFLVAELSRAKRAAEHHG